MVDLNPAGSSFSNAYGVHNGQQVGFANINFVDRAGLWSGTAASWVDLNAFLPPTLVGSYARTIWSSGGTTYVAGSGFDAQSGQEVAVLWKSGGAPCYANCDGSTSPPVLNVNDFQCFTNKFAAADSSANCDGSTVPPVLNVNDFQCFLNKFAAGCS